MNKRIYTLIWKISLSMIIAIIVYLSTTEILQSLLG
jgi:hypothetical protein